VRSFEPLVLDTADGDVSISPVWHETPGTASHFVAAGSESSLQVVGRSVLCQY